MSQQQLTESTEKAKQIARREVSLGSTQSLQGGYHSTLLQLQRTLGNQRVGELIQAKRLTREGRIIGLQPKLTVGAVDDQHERKTDHVARQVASMADPVATPQTHPRAIGINNTISVAAAAPHSLVQRDGPPPGPPDTGDKGFTCGLDDGKPGCKLDIGKGEPLSLPGNWSSPSANPSNIKGPADCPPGKYNRLLMTCCSAGTRASDDGMNCIEDLKPIPPLPEPVPEDKGDFPIPPDENTKYA